MQQRRTDSWMVWHRQRLAVLLLLLVAVPGRLVHGHDQKDDDQKRSTSKDAVPENGISVGQPKVFDNRTLTLMLESMGDTLRSVQVIDQEPLRKALGLLQGSQVTDVARSFSILSGGLPKSFTTDDSTAQTDRTLKPSAEDSSIETLIDKKVSEKLGLKTETTTSERNPALPQLPDLISAPTGLPSFGQSPFDLLSDQVNLTYQILNLRMLLERSLSDRLLQSGESRLQAVLGFNISIDPPRGSEGAAAIVEVTVTPKVQEAVKDAKGNEPVSLVALMPQEKTYNAVNVSTKSNAFGGSAIAGMTTIGYSERRRGQIFYLYRDNDTLSFERMDRAHNALAFGWQFRPVLGRKSVSPGMRQMFAVLSIPVSDAKKLKKYEHLDVSVKTYWRKYYPGTQTTADRSKIGLWPHLTKVFSLGFAQTVPTDGTVEPTASQVGVPTTARYQKDLHPKVQDVRWTRVDDANALVSIEGENFFSGTSVVMGGASAVAGVVIKSSQTMDVVTPIANIGAGTGMVIGRYGLAEPLVAKTGLCEPTGTGLVGATLSPPFAGQRELMVPALDCAPDKLVAPEAGLVIFANGKPVPGSPSISKGADSEGKDNGKTVLVASIPLDMFPKGDGRIAIVRPFRDPFRLEFPWYDSQYDVKRTSGGKGTVLFVSRKDGTPVNNESAFGKAPLTRWRIDYAGIEYRPSLSTATTLKFEIPIAEADGTFVLFEPGDAEPTLHLLEMPAAKPKPKVPVEALSAMSLSITQGDAPKIDFTGESIDQVTSAQFEGRDPFKTEYDAAKRVLGVQIPQDATKTPGSVRIYFRDKAGKLVGAVVLEIKARPGKSGEQPKG